MDPASLWPQTHPEETPRVCAPRPSPRVRVASGFAQCLQMYVKELIRADRHRHVMKTADVCNVPPEKLFTPDVIPFDDDDEP